MKEGLELAAASIRYQLVEVGRACQRAGDRPGALRIAGFLYLQPNDEGPGIGTNLSRFRIELERDGPADLKDETSRWDPLPLPGTKRGAREASRRSADPAPASREENPDMRHADHEIDPPLLYRFSPRAMSGEELPASEAMQLLEAARWAPSSGNGQPWRFVYALRGTEAFETLLGTLVEANRVWCVRAGAFILVTSATALPDGRPIASHAFDSGAAWMSLALQGSKMGLVVHAMGGFDQDAARRVAAVPADHAVHCVVAVGRPGRVEDLPEKLRPREEPNGRNPVSSFAFEGRFPA